MSLHRLLTVSDGVVFTVFSVVGCLGVTVYVSPLRRPPNNEWVLFTTQFRIIYIYY